jgi:hypothetical protein
LLDACELPGLSFNAASESRPCFVVLVAIGELPLQEIVDKSLVTEAETRNESEEVQRA